MHLRVTAAFVLAGVVSSSALLPQSSLITFNGPNTVESNGIHNIHIKYNAPVDGQLSIYYGACNIPASPAMDAHHHRVGVTAIGDHPPAERSARWKSSRPERFVWIVPENAPDKGCLHAYAGEEPIGISGVITVTKRTVRRSVPLADIADAEGPWFDGVKYLQEKEPDSIFVAQEKHKTIGILGGGMSGLMSALILDSVGFHDWEIIEASARIGGRVHTSYLNGTRPDQYQYQEMGPMRFPVSIIYPGTTDNLTINDHKMVFQLADALNKMNHNNSSLAVNFIEWIQNSPNTPAYTEQRNPDGTVPSKSQVLANPALLDNTTATYSNATAVQAASDAYHTWNNLTEDEVKLMTSNIYLAHKKAVEDGWLDFSEAGYLRYRLGIDLNITDEVSSIGDNRDSWPYDTPYFLATYWKTIDQGLSRLPTAFGPLVLNRTTFNTEVSGMSWNETTQKVSVQWRAGNLLDMATSSKEFDYVITAVPFSKVRLWRLPDYTSLLTRAIATLSYSPSCKVALQYKTRFWEHLERPILGGCGAAEIPGIGSICYPSYELNSSGPGVLLASYDSDVTTQSVSALTDEQHVALVQRAMVEVHGDIAREQYTGVYDRMCWANNELQAGAWCAPTAGQQELYLPAYFHTEKHTIFVGEHTSYTHAWIWSALESAVRGTTQLLLDMGLVDEAKAVTTEWMARWMTM